MTRENTNRTNDQTKTSTGNPSKPTVSDLTPRKELKGGALLLPAVNAARESSRSTSGGGGNDVLIGGAGRDILE